MASWCVDSQYNIDPMLGYSETLLSDQTFQDDHIISHQTPDHTMYPSSPLGRRLSAFGANIDMNLDESAPQTRSITSHRTRRSSHVNTTESLQSRQARFEGIVPYSELIWRCLKESPDFQSSLKGIYAWFMDNTDRDWSAIDAGVDQDINEGKGTTKGQSLRKGWQCSVRHNLSMNKAFFKHTEKKGVWVLNPDNYAGVESTTRFRRRPGRSTIPGTPRPYSGTSRGRADSSSERAATTRDRRQAAGRRGGQASRHNAQARHEDKNHTRRTRRRAGENRCDDSEAMDSMITPTPSPFPEARPGCDGTSYTGYDYSGVGQQRQAHPYYTPSPSLSCASIYTPPNAYATTVPASANTHLMTPPPFNQFGSNSDSNNYLMPNHLPQDLNYMGPGSDIPHAYDNFTISNTRYCDFNFDLSMQNQYQIAGYNNISNNGMSTPAPSHAFLNPYASHTPSTLSRQVTPSMIDPALEKETSAYTAEGAAGADADMIEDFGTDLNLYDAFMVNNDDMLDFKGMEGC